MSIASSQQQTYLRLIGLLRPRWRTDLSLPAEIQRLLGNERRFGSRDRRLYRELIYTTLRYLPWIEASLEADPVRAAKVTAWLAADTRDTRSYRAEIAGDWPELQTVAERASFLEADPTMLLPAWFREECPEAFAPAEIEAEAARAPLWLRLQTEDLAAVQAEFDARGWPIRPSAALPSAWQLPGDADVAKTSAYADGLLEIQDLGSQIVLESAAIPPGGRWFDACAGAGGKSLQLARILGPEGSVDAHDIRPAALEQLAARAARAGLSNVRVIAQPAAGAYDGVLVDAPCSGSGTWRRAPHLKWSTTPALVAARAALQKNLLRRFAAQVRPGGMLIYATCSLCRSENEAVVADFRSSHPGFELLPVARSLGFETPERLLTIYPARHDTDGFFVAAFRRRSAG